MAKQPPVLNSECTGEGDQIQPKRRTPHRPPRIESPLVTSPFSGHQSDEGGSSSASTPYSPNLHVNRSPQCMHVRRISHLSRTSSGYFSFEVSPAPFYCDKATQTPSLACQAFNHYLSAMGEFICFCSFLGGSKIVCL